MRKIVDWALPFVVVLGLAAMVLANPDPFARDALCARFSACFRSANPEFWNNLMYDAGLGAVVSVVFYWLLVKLPDYSKRKRLKNYLSKSYNAFRKDAVFLFLFASGSSSVNLDLVSELTSQSEFRRYFKQENELRDGNRWDDVANNIDEAQLRAILNLTNSLADDILYVLNNIDIHDEGSFSLLRSLRRAIASNDMTFFTDYNERKSTMRFFWELMSGWDPLEGYPIKDPIQDVIDRI